MLLGGLNYREKNITLILDYPLTYVHESEDKIYNIILGIPYVFTLHFGGIHKLRHKLRGVEGVDKV